MNNQRLFIFIGLFFSGFLLYKEWVIYNNPLPKQVVSTVQNNDVVNTVLENRIIQDTTKKAVEVPDMAMLTNIKPTGQSDKEKIEHISVITDLFKLRINKKGAVIDDLWLNDYPVSIKEKEPTVKLFNTDGDRFYAQSGLIPKDFMPTHLSDFTSKKSNFEMTDDVLIVPFYWQLNDIQVVKIYRFKQGSYTIELSYEVTNSGDTAKNFASYLQLFRGKQDEEGSFFLPTFKGAALFNDQGVYEKIEFEDFNKKDYKSSTLGGWIAMVQHYFLAAWIPNQANKQLFRTQTSSQDGYIISSLDESASMVKPGETKKFKAGALYVGPKLHVNINQIDGLDKTVDYGILYIIAKPLEIVLHYIYDFIKSWGYAIILLTILIKLVFYKLSETSYRSMAKMRKLTPKMKQLKEIYGDDKKKVSQKMMEMYKKEKANPAAGCLPILVQIPVFIALYWVLLESVELRHASFWWIKDLSDYDPYFVLPILMGVSMFIQQKLNPPPPDPTQAKVMMALPFIFTVFFIFFPSGLVLYWVVNNVLSILQQWLIIKRFEDK